MAMKNWTIFHFDINFYWKITIHSELKEKPPKWKFNFSRGLGVMSSFSKRFGGGLGVGWRGLDKSVPQIYEINFQNKMKIYGIRVLGVDFEDNSSQRRLKNTFLDSTNCSDFFFIQLFLLYFGRVLRVSLHSLSYLE